jgi:uncharacterized protein YdhG (YjbR/CyaY superfamily)
MWTCPRCKRTFKNQNQSHYCGDAPKTIDEYIAAQPEDVQPYLNQVRAALKTALPGAQERISWSMPTYWQEHNLIHFAAGKNHLGLYPGPAAVAEFAEALSGYKTSKGAIRIPYGEPMPLELIVRIARWCAETGNRP